MVDNGIRIIMCVDLDYFYAQVEEIRDPSIKGKPVIVCVYSGRTKDSGAVSTCNYIARNSGVRSGMPIALAKRIMAEHPEAVFLPMDHEYYESVSNRVMALLKEGSPRFEQASIDEAYLDATQQSAGDYALARDLSEKLKAEIFDTEHLTCTIGIGPNKLVSKMAVDSKKPNGLTVILPGKVREYFDTLPIGKLFGIGPKIEKKLASLRILTVAQLAAFDVQILSRNFGEKMGPQLRDAALGIDEEPVREREIEQFSRIVTLKENALSFTFEEILAPLAKDLSNKLVAANMTCQSIGIIAITSQLRTKTRSRKTDNPTDSDSEILEVASDLFRIFFAEEKLETEWTPVRRVGIRLFSLKKRDGDIREKSLTDFL
ncbi:MAG: DNA polymerase IV [Thaumarchaeota archaeon]|nr:DNA polymerase IV [Nitrososphaerota archaeon]